MIHAYLFLEKGIEGSNGHGEEFKSLMKYINEREGTHIKVIILYICNFGAFFMCKSLIYLFCCVILFVSSFSLYYN